MRHPDPSPADLLLCQPAILDPAQLDLALGIQHAWACELGKCGLHAHPVLLGRPPEGSGAQMLYHRVPLRLQSIARMYARIPDGLPALALQSQLSIFHPSLCTASARLGTLPGGLTRHATQCATNLRGLLDWMDALVADVCTHFERPAPTQSWRDIYDTSDPREAIYLLHLSGAIIRENMGLLDEPVRLGTQRRPLPSYMD